MRDPGEWVSRLQAGEDEAWQEYVRVFSRFVPIVSARLGLLAGDHEEILQEMTVTAYRSIGNLRDPTRLASWTFTIARRSAIAYWRSRRKHSGSSGSDSPEFDRVRSGDVPIDEILESWEEGHTLRQAVEDLRPDCRRLVEALFLEEPRASYREVSERFAMPVGSIGPTLARCLEKLRRAWKSVSGGP